MLIISRKNNGGNVDLDKTQAEKDRFKLLCYQAETVSFIHLYLWKYYYSAVYTN